MVAIPGRLAGMFRGGRDRAGQVRDLGVGMKNWCREDTAIPYVVVAVWFGPAQPVHGDRLRAGGKANGWKKAAPCPGPVAGARGVT